MTSDRVAHHLQFLPIAIGRYQDPRFPDLDAESEAVHVAELLSDFQPVVVSWSLPAEQRGLDAIFSRLVSWSSNLSSGNAILYWVGHGWSNDSAAALATYYTEHNWPSAAVTPDSLAEFLNERERAPEHGWTLAIFDTCRSSRFAELLGAHLLHTPHGARRVLLLGVSGDGMTRLGRFRGALAHALNNTFAANTSIGLIELIEALRSDLGGNAINLGIGDSALVRKNAVISTNTPLDVAAELGDVLAELSEEERFHFIPKSQGGETSESETGELAWYFQGRSDETRHIASWLRQHHTGMLIVSGRPGSGKSALLGHVLVQSRPRLRELLLAHGLMPEISAEDRPADDAFNHSLLLTGTTVGELIRTLAELRGFPAPPATITTTRQARWLLDQFLQDQRPLTLLVDGLDEAQEPITIAELILRPMAAIPDMRIVVGTRGSTNDAPDLPDAPFADILAALGQDAAILLVQRDPHAIARYVRRRLRNLESDTTADRISEIALDIALTSHEFLFARLAIQEIYARPTLLTTEHDTLQALLAGNYSSLFGATLERLRQQSPKHYALLAALAFAQGRGAPIRDNVWAALAHGLHPHITVHYEDIDAAIKAAAPYLMLDVVDGDTVYRLAHQTFREHLIAIHDEPDLEIRLVRAILASVDLTDGRSTRLAGYIARHLSEHVARAGAPGWRALADKPDILDNIDQISLSVNAIDASRGLQALPQPITAVIAARYQLITNPPASRHGIRQLAMARHHAARSFEAPLSSVSWNVRSAHLRQYPLHTTMRGHSGPAWRITAFQGDDGQPLLASGSRDGTVRIWDPVAGIEVGVLIHFTSTIVRALTTMPDAGRSLVVSCSDDHTIRLWDPRTGSQVGPSLNVHSRPILSVTSITAEDGRTLLATGSADSTIKITDPATGEISKALTGHSAGVWTLNAYTDEVHGMLLVSGGGDGTLRIWNPDTQREIGEPIAAHDGAIRAATLFRDSDGTALLSTGGADGTVRVWNLRTRSQVRDPIINGHGGAVSALISMRAPTGRTVLASGGPDGTVRMWDVDSGDQIGEPLTGHGDTIEDIAAFQGVGTPVMLATASVDGTIRVWEAFHGTHVDIDPPTEYDAGIDALVEISAADGRALLATGSSDGNIRIWDPISGVQVGDSLSYRTGQLQGLVAGKSSTTGELLVSCGAYSGVQVWDPANGEQTGRELTGMGSVRALSAFVGSDGRHLLAMGENGLNSVIWIWDPRTNVKVGQSLTGHSGPVTAVTSFVGNHGQVLLASGSTDGTVRVWNPATASQVGPTLSGRPDWGSAMERYDFEDLFVAQRTSETTAYVYYAESGQDAGFTLTAYPSSVLALTPFSSVDGATLLAAGHYDGLIHIWNPTTGSIEGELLDESSGPVESITAVRTADDNVMLATGSKDGTVRVWDPTAAQMAYSIPIGSSITSLCAVDGGLGIGCTDGWLVCSLRG